MTVAERILAVLAERGMTKAELERRAGLAQNRVHKWAAGTGEPTRPQLERIAVALGLPLERLTSDAPADPGRAYLASLINRYGVEACVAWILEGSRRAVEPAAPPQHPPAPAEGTRVVIGDPISREASKRLPREIPPGAIIGEEPKIKPTLAPPKKKAR